MLQTQVTAPETGMHPVAPSAEALARLADLAGQVPLPDLAAEAAALAERVRRRGFHLACVGQFNRGKSTLLNALVAHPVLPTGALPVTSVPVVLQFGALAARVRLAGPGAWQQIRVEDVARYVTESGNPHNRKQVAAVEVFVPAPALANGLCLVDTPGLGSVFTWNTETAHAFVPHIDALLIVTGADPPITGHELELVRQVADARIPCLLVLNKADRAGPGESREAADFARHVLDEQLGRTVNAVYHVSATEAAAGLATRDWPALTHMIGQLAAASGEDLAAQAARRGTTRVRQLLLSHVRERRDTLARPIEDIDRRAAALQVTLDAAQRSALELAPVLRMENRLLVRRLDERRDRFLAESEPLARAELAARLGTFPATRRRRAALDIAVDIARAWVLPWLEASEAAGEQACAEATGRMVGRANQLLERLRLLDPVLAISLPHELSPPDRFGAARHFYFLEYQHLVAPTGLAWLARTLEDRCLPRAQARIARAAEHLLYRLLRVNAARVQNDITDRITQAQRDLEVSLRRQLGSAAAVATDALVRARQLHAEGSGAIARELQRLDRLAAQAREVACEP